VTKKTVLAIVVAMLWLSGPAEAQTAAGSADEGRFYGRAEYLLWWMKDGPQSLPLVTDGFANAPSTRVFLGGDDIDHGSLNGFRLSLGYWLTNDRAWGVEASGFYLPEVTDKQSVSSSGLPGSVNLAVPFFDPVRNQEAFSSISDAGAFSGTASTRASARLWGVEGNVVWGLANPRPFRLELLGGFRYMNLAEGLAFRTSSPDLPPGPVTVFETNDSFDATNDFYGGQIGMRAKYEAGRFMADATLKLALGAMRQHVDVNGSFTTNFFSPAIQTFRGGMFAQSTNIGHHSRTVFAVIPEVGGNLGFRLTNWATVTLGYTFLYASNVARPGNQMDRVINPTQSQAISLNNPATLTGAARPSFKFDGTDFWAHGLNVGIALNF
jgi:Putative beta barrel porin-7 (BBP7)